MFLNYSVVIKITIALLRKVRDSAQVAQQPEGIFQIPKWGRWDLNPGREVFCITFMTQTSNTNQAILRPLRKFKSLCIKTFALCEYISKRFDKSRYEKAHCTHYENSYCRYFRNCFEFLRRRFFQDMPDSF